MIKLAKLPLSAENYLPKERTLIKLRLFAKKCHGCPLYKDATQTVFGQGKKSSQVMLVGEIPGQKEDETGLPFTGPAGILLRHCVQDAGLDFEDVYFTNVVKHFKFAYINNRRMHRSPVSSEIRACLPWLENEIAVIKPKVILCLGSTAAKALVKTTFRVTTSRGKWLNFNKDTKIIVSFHPSAILRARKDKDRHRMRRLLTNDIKKIVNYLNHG